MGILNTLKKMVTGADNENPDVSYTKELDRCLVDIKLTKGEYKLLSIYYYRGYTSYRDIYRYVFLNNMTKIDKVIDGAESKAKSGCNIDFTYIRFKFDEKKFIDIPFDVFSQKRNMTISRRNNKIWNRANLKRMLATDPSLRTLDDDLISESMIREAIEEIIKEQSGE